MGLFVFHRLLTCFIDIKDYTCFMNKNATNNLTISYQTPVTNIHKESSISFSYIGGGFFIGSKTSGVTL